MKTGIHDKILYLMENISPKNIICTRAKKKSFLFSYEMRVELGKHERKYTPSIYGFSFIEEEIEGKKNSNR